MTQPRIWVDMITGAGWCCRSFSLASFARWRAAGHMARVEVIGVSVSGALS